MWLENEMKGNIPSDFDMRYIPSLIQDKGQKYVICAYSHNLCIPKKSKNPEIAKAWLAFLYREKNLSRFTELVGVPTAYKMDLSESNVSERAKDVQKWVANPNSIMIYDEKSMDERVTKVLDVAINGVVAGKFNARDACEMVQKEADKVLAEKNKK
jgi:N-acetylglucosamine transport system substrate-binding protein